MKNFKLIIAFVAVSIFSVGMSWPKDVQKEQLSDVKWVLKQINNRNAYELFADKTPYIVFNFDIEQLSGNSGCNYFSGNFKYSGGKLEVPNIEPAGMSCPGNVDESLFTGILAKQSKLSIMNGDLIFSQDDKPVMVFYRAQPLTSMDLAGVWRLKTLEGKDAGSKFSKNMPTLEFDFVKGRIMGNAGCNNYNSMFTLSKNVLEIQPLITTRMSCDDMDGEKKFVAVLQGRMDIDIEKDVMVFRKDNKVVMTFER